MGERNLLCVRSVQTWRLRSDEAYRSPVSDLTLTAITGEVCELGHRRLPIALEATDAA